jgi:hypothetical protein
MQVICNMEVRSLNHGKAVSIKFYERLCVYQDNENYMMHFSFSLLRIKGLCMFRELHAHHQEALHKRHLVYCVCVMSVGCTRIEVELVSGDTSST